MQDDEHSVRGMVFAPTLLERFMRWLGYNKGGFPIIPPEIEDRLPIGVSGVVDIRLDALDRVRVLFTGRVRVDIRHQYERDPGEAFTHARASVMWGHWA